MTIPALIAAAGALTGGIADARTGLIPNAITRTTTVAALGAAALRGELLAGSVGALTAGGLLLALFVLTRGRGIGLGDVKLAAAVGAGTGAVDATAVLTIAFIAGAAFGIWLLASGRARRGDAVRFGPFIAAGALTVVLAGNARA